MSFRRGETLRYLLDSLRHVHHVAVNVRENERCILINIRSCPYVRYVSLEVYTKMQTFLRKHSKCNIYPIADSQLFTIIFVYIGFQYLVPLELKFKNKVSKSFFVIQLSPFSHQFLTRIMRSTITCEKI